MTRCLNIRQYARPARQGHDQRSKMLMISCICIVSKISSDIRKNTVFYAQSLRSFRQTTKGDKSRTLSLMRKFGQSPSFSPHRFVSKSALFECTCARGCRRSKYKTYCFLVIYVSKCRRQRRFTSISNHNVSALTLSSVPFLINNVLIICSHYCIMENKL